MERTDPHDDQNGPDFHRADLETKRHDNLVLLALGGAVPADFDRHHSHCARCRADLDAYAHTVALGRDASARREYLDATPADSVWAAITAELRPSERRRPDPVRSSRRRTPYPGAGRRAQHLARSRYALVAAAIVLGLAGTVGGYLAGHSAGSAQSHVASNARLAGVPGGPSRVTGSATVHSSSAGRQVTVTTSGLALRNGFYEVWLYDPDRGRAGDMVAIGALGDRGRGTFTLPSGIDIHAYHVVNISAQSYGAGASIVHARSVLQGSLTH